MYALACTRKIDVSCGLQVTHTSYDNDKRNLQPATAVAFRFEELGIHSRKQALAFGKKPNARIQGTEVSGIGKNAQSGVFFSNFAP